MSTIASPREPSLRRFPSGTPTSSNRPSLDTLRSTVTSPVNAPSQPALSNSSTGPPGGNKRSNRVALREYYNIRNASGAGGPPGTPRIEIRDSEVPASDIDATEFDADEYVNKVVAESSLEELLRLYTRVLGEVRALDAEKKALVYDNYSKLISATETIRKMRANMDPLNPMASTLDPAMAQIYSQASSIREALRQTVPPPDSEEGKKRKAEAARRRTKQLATEVLATPERLRTLVKDGKLSEAKKQWELPRELLVSWQEKGVGGDDVQACIDDGDAALKPAQQPDSTRSSRDER